jgi:hypothetical protein
MTMSDVGAATSHAHLGSRTTAHPRTASQSLHFALLIIIIIIVVVIRNCIAYTFETQGISEQFFGNPLKIYLSLQSSPSTMTANIA